VKDFNWVKFGERVPVDTKIQYISRPPDSQLEFDGTMLENYPHADEAFAAAHPHSEEVLLRTAAMWPKLQYRPARELPANQAGSTYSFFIDRVKYFINGTWQTLDEVMA
jgi:hypothetical protein